MIKINGKEIDIGNVKNISVENNQVMINNIKFDLKEFSDTYTVNIQVDGNVSGNIKTNGNVTVSNNVGGDIDTNGHVEVLKGDVKGSIDTNGHVEVGGNVYGDIDTNGKVIIKGNRKE